MFIKLTIIGKVNKSDYKKTLNMRVNILNIQGYWYNDLASPPGTRIRIYSPKDTDQSEIRRVKESVQEIDEMVEVAQSRVAKVLFGSN